MALIAAWVIAVLGIGHIIVGLVFFRKPIAEAVSEGGFGRFQQADRRRLAFWFTIFGPLVLAVGHTAIIAATRGDVLLLKTMGYYLSRQQEATFCFSRRWATTCLVPRY